MDRVLSLVTAGYRWRGFRVAGPLILAAAAAVSSYANHPTLDFRLAVPLGLLAAEANDTLVKRFFDEDTFHEATPSLPRGARQPSGPPPPGHRWCPAHLPPDQRGDRSVVRQPGPGVRACGAEVLTERWRCIAR